MEVLILEEKKKKEKKREKGDKRENKMLSRFVQMQKLRFRQHPSLVFSEKRNDSHAGYMPA